MYQVEIEEDLAFKCQAHILVILELNASERLSSVSHSLLELRMSTLQTITLVETDHKGHKQYEQVQINLCNHIW